MKRVLISESTNNTMQKIALIIIAVTISAFSYGQTKKISLKSHSGTMANFSMNEKGNLGEFRPTPRLNEKTKVDTVCKKVMVYDSVSTYQFLLKEKKAKDAEATKDKKKKGKDKK
jgi:hypothetical protein